MCKNKYHARSGYNNVFALNNCSNYLETKAIFQHEVDLAPHNEPDGFPIVKNV